MDFGLYQVDESRNGTALSDSENPSSCMGKTSVHFYYVGAQACTAHRGRGRQCMCHRYPGVSLRCSAGPAVLHAFSKYVWTSLGRAFH
jgi:hypothetical protein